MVYCDECGKEIAQDMNYCPYCGSPTKKAVKEVYSVSSEDLAKRIKELIHEGNVTKIIIKNEKDETLLEIPATIGLIGVLLAPWMAALGVIAAVVTKCKIIVVRREE
jgi:uncharacterized membrane protein YvbJ